MEENLTSVRETKRPQKCYTLDTGDLMFWVTGARKGEEYFCFCFAFGKQMASS